MKQYYYCIEDYHGHLSRNYFYAENDKEAIQKFNDIRGLGYGDDYLAEVKFENNKQLFREIKSY